MATRMKPLSVFMLVAALAVSSVAIPAAAWATETPPTEVVSSDSVSPSPEAPVVEVAPSPVVEDTAQAPVVAEQPVAPDPVVVPEQPLVVVDTPIVPTPVVETPVAPRQVFGTPGISGVETCGAVTLTFTYPATVGENDYVYPVDFHWVDGNGDTQTIVQEGNGAPTVVTVSFVSGSNIQSTRAWVSIGEDDPIVFTSDCTTPPVPVETPCVDGSSLTWTNNANLSTATVTLKKGITSCDVSLNSYQTEGSSWATSGTQVLIDHAAVRLTTQNPSGNLMVNGSGCYRQQDLYIGTTKYDGTDGALPHYPDSTVPRGLIDWWNGKVGECATPPTVITVQPAAPLWYDYCGTERDLSVPPSNTAEYSYVKSVEAGVVYYTLAFNKGYEADGKIQTTWQYSFTNERCEGEPMPIEEEVLPPTFDDFCGTADDGVNIPADGEHFYYVEVRQIQDGEIVVDVNAVADGGWYFANDVMTAWSHVFKDAACPIVPPVVVPPVVTPPVLVPPVVTPPAVTTVVVAPITPGVVPGGGTDGADLASTKKQTTAINGVLPFGVFGLVALLLGLGFLIKRRLATD